MIDDCVAPRSDAVGCGNYHSVPYRFGARRAEFGPSALNRYFAVLYRHLPFDDRYSVYGRYAMLHPSHGSVGSLRTVWSGTHIFDRGDVARIHESVLDTMMQPNPSKRPSMAFVEHSLYCLKYGMQLEDL
jgi:hypothetical protein